MSWIKPPSITISTGPSLGRASSPSSARQPNKVLRTCSAQFSQSEYDCIVQRPRRGRIHPMSVERVHLVIVALDVEQIRSTGITGDAIHCHPKEFVLRLPGILDCKVGPDLGGHYGNVPAFEIVFTPCRQSIRMK